MSTWIYMITATRPEMTKTGPNEYERAAFLEHSAYLEKLRRDGVLLIAGRTLGETSMGLAIINADSEADATAIMNADPFITRGVVTGKLEGFSLA